MSCLCNTNNIEYILTDVVECGHFRDIGGTVEVSFIFNKIISSLDKKEYLKIIDTLDHCLITDEPTSVNHSYRYFLLDKCSSFIEDVAFIMAHHIILGKPSKPLYVTSIQVKFGKETLSVRPSNFRSSYSSQILKMNTEG